MKKALPYLFLMLIIPGILYPQSIAVGPQAGYYKTTDADEGSFMYGGAIRLKMGPGFGLEASINYRQENYSDGDITLRSWPIMASVMLYPLPIIYGVAGAGWYNATLDYSGDLSWVGDNTTSEFGWHLGGGAELPLGNAALLSGDIRYVFLDYKFDTIPNSDDLSSDFFVITVGLYFKL